MEDQGRWPVAAPWVREAVAGRPRHLFAPSRLWDWNGETYVPVDRGSAPDGWAALVYAGPAASAVTQITDGLPSSSLSCPAIVADMLDSLMPEPGHRVLELGTGTGWNAALLEHRTGPGTVTSVEYDPQLAAAARERLEDVGSSADVQVGDGSEGRPAGAPYDRVESTYAVEEVPWSWVEQTRPGGRIVAPWGRMGHVALTVADDGRSATGWMQGLATFMPARGTGQGLSLHQVRTGTPIDSEEPLTYDPRPLHADMNLLFALRVQLADVRVHTEAADAGTTVWLHDGRSSRATLLAPAQGPGTVYQGGPRRLADELGHAWRRWEKRGSPGLYDFGMTVTPGSTRVWSGDEPRTAQTWLT
ncbi:methyltransferase domain-containing protein [Streptomyces sp. NPDC059788]|uniref:methyltransferase domain-containing protein n=1 Tax=Streptomyces sp. NPDC059788 TaxID=3346948 RepID=UPI00366086E8